MSEIIPAPQAEIRAISQEESEKRIFKAELKLYAKAEMFGSLRDLMRCAILYNWRESGRYKFGCDTWIEFCGKLQTNKMTASRYLNTARGLIKRCPKAVTIENEKFLFDSSKMEAEFRALLKSEGDVTLESLARLGANANGLRNYFYDEHAGADIHTEDALNMLIGNASATDEAPAAKSSQSTLFTMHERILAAGFSCNADGVYFNPDGSEMSDDQLSEFIDDETGMKVFSEVNKVLTPIKNSLQNKIQQFAKFASLYRMKHQSPIAEKLFSEKHEELIAECAGLLHDVSTMFETEE